MQTAPRPGRRRADGELAARERPRPSALPVALALTLHLAGCQPKERYPGALQGVVEHREVAVAFEIGGRVSQIGVRAGDRVEAGALVARVDETLALAARAARLAEVAVAEAEVKLLRAGTRPEEIRAAAAQLNAIKAQEALLTRNLERERGLLDKGASTSSVIDEVATRLSATGSERQSAEQRLQELRKGARGEQVDAAVARVQALGSAARVEDERIARHVLKSPLTGEVVDVHVEPGEIVAPGVPVATLVDVSHPYADVFVPANSAAGLAPGRKARAQVDSLAEPLGAVIERVATTTEFTPRFLFSERERPNLVLRVRVRIDDPKRRLVAGLPVFVTLLGEGGAQ